MLRREDEKDLEKNINSDEYDFDFESLGSENSRHGDGRASGPAMGEQVIDVMFADWTDVLYESVSELQIEHPDISIVAISTDSASLIENTKQLFPDVIVLAYNLPGMPTIPLIQTLVKEYPQIPLIVMIDESEVDVTNRLIHAGAKDTFVRQDFGIDELAALIRKVYQDELRRRAEERAARKKLEEAEREREARRRRAASKPASPTVEVVREKQQVISFYSPKGGLGTTTLAVNTALALGRLAKAHNDDLKVILVDCDFGYGNVGDTLVIPNKTNIYDVVQTYDEKEQKFDPHALNKAIVRYDNIDVLLAPNRLEFNDLIEDVHIKTLIHTLRDKGYDVIIIDTTSHLSDTTLAALQASMKIFFVISQDLPTIRISQQVIDLLTGRLSIPPSAIRLVLSQIIQGVGIAPSDIRDYMNFPIVATIPEDRRLVMNSLNSGHPIALGQSNPLQNSIKRIAGMISPALGRHLTVEDTTTGGSGGGFFAALFGSKSKEDPKKKKKRRPPAKREAASRRGGFRERR